MTELSQHAPTPDTEPAILALDSGSPTVSVAVARGGRSLVQRQVEIGRSSQRLLPMIDDALASARVPLAELGGIVALGGPGSFTGLRVGLATALGLHQALGVPATAVPTLAALAEAAPRPDDGSRRRVVALVDVLRGEWACREFRLGDGPPRPAAPAERVATGDLARRFAGDEPAWLVGFGVGTLADPLKGQVEAGRFHLHEPGALAAVAARAASLRPPAWEVDRLTDPVYFRPPAVTRPKARRS